MAKLFLTKEKQAEGADGRKIPPQEKQGTTHAASGSVDDDRILIFEVNFSGLPGSAWYSHKLIG